MSKEKNNLGDKTEKIFDDAKETVKETAEKIEEKASEFKEDAKEAFEDVKKEAKEFANDTKQTFSDGKNIAILAHLTIIGWIVAFILNNQNKTELGSFYVRQVLGIMLVGLLTMIPVIGWFIGVLCLALLVISLINAIGGNTKPVFLVGDKFQEWFSSF